MKLLRETIRRIILQESMITADQLRDDVFIRIQRFGKRAAKIQYAHEDPRQTKLFPNPSDDPDDCWGTIVIEKGINGKPVWQVTSSQSGEGYGPLLYDIAMEYATQNGLGLMSDRNAVSDGEDGAVNVWNYYLENRVGDDVQAHQMDDLENTLTDTYDDNVDQFIPKAFAKENWDYHSTSKRYTKAPTTMDALDGRILYT